MDLGQEIAGILGDAEQKLSALAADALRRKDYTSLHRLSAVAEKVATADTLEAQFNPIPATSIAPLPSDDDGEQARLRPRHSPPQHLSYPRFFRDSDQLVKIGYSKSERRTYEHRSPRDVLLRMATILDELGTNGRHFSTDEFLPPREKRLAGIPSYQLYLCLAFLLRLGMICRHGRAGYTTAPDCYPLKSHADRAWSELSAR